MPDSAHLKLDELGHVVADQLKAWTAELTADIGLAAAGIVVEGHYFLDGLILAGPTSVRPSMQRRR